MLTWSCQGFAKNVFIYFIICWKNNFFFRLTCRRKKIFTPPPTGPLRRWMHRFVFLGFFSGLSVTNALCNRRNAALVHVPQGSRKNSCLNESITFISLDSSGLSPSLTTFTTFIWTFQSLVIIALQRRVIATLDTDVHGRKKKSEEEEEEKKLFPSCHDFFSGRHVDYFHQSESVLLCAQPIRGQEVLRVSVGVISQEEASADNITKVLR